MNNNKNNNQEIIEAAGGLLWRNSTVAEEVAIIHRPKYNDWTLPKGKREPGESWTDTALREVQEETGCLARLRGFAGGNIYTVDATPKIVLFWHMIFEIDLGFSPNDEVDKLVWLSPTKAIQRMTYPSEKALLKRNDKD